MEAPQFSSLSSLSQSLLPFGLKTLLNSVDLGVLKLPSTLLLWCNPQGSKLFEWSLISGQFYLHSHPLSGSEPSNSVCGCVGVDGARTPSLASQSLPLEQI